MSAKLIVIERCLIVLGLICLSLFAMSRLHAAYGEQAAIDDVNAIIASNQAKQKPLSDDLTAEVFILDQAVEQVSAISPSQYAAKNQYTAQNQSTPHQITNEPFTHYKISDAAEPKTEPSEPNMSDWSQTRIDGFTTAEPTSPLLGLLSIPSIKLEVAVFDGIAEVNLNRGVGRVIPSRRMNGEGNLSLAGHRDGFFRKIGQLTLGQQLSITDLNGEVHRFRVVDTWIVEPKDTYVMKRTSKPSVTLITCYPFYFVGSAPQRYIVRAEKF